jgi:hypothetical protein
MSNVMTSRRRKNRGRRQRVASRGVSLDPRSLGQAGKFTYFFTQLLSISSDSKGVAAGVIVTDPTSSGQNYAEWSAIQTLFNECRVIRMKCVISPGDSKFGGDAIPLCLAFNLNITTAPTSATNVLEKPSHRTLYLGSTSNSGLTMSQSWPRDLPFANTTTPTPSSLTAGCPGCLGWYADGHTASVKIAWVVCTTWYQVRNRS